MLTRGLHASTVRNDLFGFSAIGKFGIKNGLLATTKVRLQAYRSKRRALGEVTGNSSLNWATACRKPRRCCRRIPGSRCLAVAPHRIGRPAFRPVEAEEGSASV